MTAMYNPPHPGEVLWGLHMEPVGLTVTEVAHRLGVDRKTLSRIVNGRASVTAEMAIRLGKAFRTTAELWLNMQCTYELWQARRSRKVDVAKIRPFPREHRVGG